MDLKGKIAVVTGASGAIGSSISEELLKLNAKVVLMGRTEKKLKKLAERLDKNLKNILYYSCDVGNEESLSKIKDFVLEKWERIDILVTCSAAPSFSERTEKLNFDDWRKILSLDLDGVFLSCKVFGAEMIKNRYGRIVNLTSFHTVATYPERAAYNAAKSGVEGLTRALAVEWGKYGIAANTVAPGPILTPRTEWFLSQNSDNKNGMIGRTPNARLGTTEDVAYLVAFLVSDQSSHINGQQIVVDGGWTKSAWWGKYGKDY